MRSLLLKLVSAKALAIPTMTHLHGTDSSTRWMGGELPTSAALSKFCHPCIGQG